MFSRIAAFTILAWTTAAFYLPGIEPVSYKAGEPVDIRVNSLRSLSEIIPYDYYDLPFCKPEHVAYANEAIGEIIWGDRRESSLYQLSMKKNSKCELLHCSTGSDDKLFKAVDKLETFINKGYRGYMSIDNLPMFNNGSLIYFGRCEGNVPLEQQYLFQRGYALGVAKQCKGKTLVNNHIEFRIEYHEVKDEKTGQTQFRVVGFTGTPYSIKHRDDGGDCNAIFDPEGSDQLPLTTDDLRNKVKPRWSYGVTWVNQPGVSWATRWDSYLNTSIADSNAKVHWLYIVTSLVVTLCLSLIASVILLRALHRDFNRYNSPDPDDNQEEVGWKLVHADVFRPPYRSQLLAAIVGNGAQIIFMCVTVLFFAVLGFLSPANRGSLLTAIILLFVLMSLVAGYVCGKLLKQFDNQEWKWVFICGMFFPGLVCGLYFLTDVINAVKGASDAVPFLTLLTIFALWLCISVPLTVLGASFAFHQGAISNPVNTGKLAREIPAQRWYFSSPLIYVLPPLAPLGAAFMELKFILSSIWQGMVYYVFGFLAIVFAVWLITVALTTIIVVYYMLCYENHRWWWSSFFIPGAMGLHVFGYCVYFFMTQLDITTPAGTFIYMTYMGLASLGYGLAAGSCGFLATLIFVRKIYGSIKID